MIVRSTVFLRSSVARLIAIFGPALLTLLVGGLIIIALYRAMAERELVTHTYEVIGAADRVLARATDAETGQRGFLLTSDERYLDPYLGAGRDVTTELARLHTLTADNSVQQARVDTLDLRLQERLAMLATVIATQREHGAPAAARLIGTGHGKQLMDEARRLSANLKTEDRRLLAIRQGALQQSLRLTIAVASFGILLAFALAAVARWLLARATGEREAAHARLAEAHEQLQGQAIELEQQMEEAQALTEELNESNHQLQESNVELEEARAVAEAAESAARDGDAMLRGIMASAGDAVFVKGLDRRYRAMNDAGARLAGTTSAEIVGKADVDLIPPDAAQRARAADQRVFESGLEDRSEDRFRLNGEWRTFLTVRNPYRDTSGAIIGIVGVATDITERKRREDDLRVIAEASRVLASSLDYDNALSSAATIVVPSLADWCSVALREEDGAIRVVAVAHVDPHKVKWAEELNRRYPANPDEATGLPHVLRTGQSELYNDITDELLVAGAHDNDHLRILRELGLTSVLVVPMTARGRTLGAITLVTTAESGRRYTAADQTLAEELARRAAVAVDNARLLRDAQLARVEAEAANKAKTDFLAQMSHELRTPLNAIRGYAELIEIGIHGPVTEPQREALARIRRSEEHLLTLINDILDYAKLEVGRATHVIQNLPINEVLTDVEALVALQMQAKGVRYENRLCDASAMVLADRDRVAQIIINLLSNALKATQAGGTVTTWCDLDETSAHIRVRDDGIGIPQDKLEAIFEPFVQLEQGLTRTTRGAGLGLAISRGLARTMGGDVTVTSTVGTGSTFTLDLPRPPAGSSPGSGSSRRQAAQT
ncbi:MAG: hypothetical protein NVS4B3_09210 [Gemmatimonadaceae bacterium]